MARSELVLHRVRRAYERAHARSALRGVGLAAAVAVASIGLHRTTHFTWIVVALLAATLATLGWRGGPYRRGGLAGMVAGLPVFVAPALYFALTHGGHCPDCMLRPTLTCLSVCFGTSAAVGVLVGRVARHDRRFALAAVMTALLTGLVGCGTLGAAGALGVVVGLVGGSVTGWIAAPRATA
jgi:hypothetical protein